MSLQVMLIVSLVGAAFLGLNIISAYPDGAPEETCDSMNPGHEVRDSTAAVKPLIEPQTGPPYFRILVDKTNVKPGDEVQVTIVADKLYFEGFIIQARDVNPQGSDGGEVKKYGTFTALSNKTKVLCNNKALTHAVHEHFNNITTQWTAPNITVENIRFTATVVKGYSTFFMNVHSETLNFSGTIFNAPSFVLVVFMFCFPTGLMNF